MLGSPFHAPVVVVDCFGFFVEDGGVHRSPRVLAGVVLRQVRAPVNEDNSTRKNTKHYCYLWATRMVGLVHVVVNF